MSQTVSLLNAEGSSTRLVQRDFLGGHNSEYVSKKSTKRFEQRKMNSVFQQVEKELDSDIIAFFATRTELQLKHIRNFHVNPNLKTAVRAAKFKEVVGFTVTVFEFENGPKLFSYSICQLGDNFSRLEGRVISKRRAYREMLKSLPRQEYNRNTGKPEGSLTTQVLNYGLKDLPINNPEVATNFASLTDFKIANWIVKHCIKTVVEKEEPKINSLLLVNETEAIKSVHSQLIEKHNLKPNSLQTYVQYVRKYNTSHFNGLLGTPAFFKESPAEGKALESYGGYTVYGIKAETLEGKVVVFVTYAECIDRDAFIKACGRKQCLINISKHKYQMYNLSNPINFTEGLITLLQGHIQRAVNVEMAIPAPSSLELVPPLAQ